MGFLVLTVPGELDLETVFSGCNICFELHATKCEILLTFSGQVELLECIKELLRIERDWVPDEEGFSIYIRPLLIGTHPFLGVCPTREAMLFVILSPVGPYFPSGLKPIKLYVETQNVRAFPGGVGDTKIGGNYAPTLLPQLNGTQLGCSQVRDLSITLM